jgi:hypothetical protein
MATFVTLIRAALEELNENPHPITGVTTGAGTVDALVDTTNLKDTSAKADTSRHAGKWLRFWDSAGTPVENIRKIMTDTPSTGTLVPEASFTLAPGVGKAYEIHEKLHPTRLKQAINDILAELRHQEILPLTLVADGDMVGTVVATYWGNSNATPAYDTAKVLFGTQSLSVAATAANGYAYPKTNLAVTPGETLLVWAPVYGDQKQAELVLYDVTHSAEIEMGRHDEEGWALLLFTATVPAGCYEVRPHLRTKINAGTTYWDHVGILKLADKVCDSPSWLTKDQDFIQLVSFPYGSGLTSPNADNAYKFWRYGPENRKVVNTIPAQRGVVPLRLDLQDYPSQPLFVVGRRRYPSLTADTDVSTADPTTVKAGALALVYRRLGPDYADRCAYWTRLFSDIRRGDEPGFTVRQRSCWVR